MRPRIRPPVGLALTVLTAALGLAACRAADRGPVRVLILSGQNNHDWNSTTPKLKSILEAGGRFRVDVTERPDLLTSRSLERYDVILSNWNAFGREAASAAWPELARSSYLEFLRRGKGHVVVHAGSSSFPAWEVYGRLTLAAWKDGQTSHGPRHEFPVRIDDPRHPVTQGLGPFTIRDELWNRPGMAAGAEVLASSYSAPEEEGTGAWEPAVLAGRFGRGRSLTILLGHDAEAMDNPGFQALVRRGVEWAATGRVTRTAEPAGRDWRWEEEPGRSLALAASGEQLWRFRYDPALDTPYFHPLNTVAGRALTWDRPPDHIWHHGLWFSWKFLNGVNYWEIDPKSGRPAGRTSWSNVRIEAGSDLVARIALELAYRPAGGEAPVLAEKRTIEVRPPDGQGVYSMDWTCDFQATGKVVLDRTPIPGEPGGQGWGGYAGLSLRFTGELAERQAVTSDGPVAEMPDGRYRGRHTAVDYSGLLEGKPEGVAILGHPANPRSPTPWYVIRSEEMGFFSPALLCYGPMTLGPGERLVLRYRVLVHPGRWDAARLRAECGKYFRRPPG